jgi:hypothetical protein
MIMSKKTRLIALLVILVTMLAVNVAQAAVSSDTAVAAESDTPCTDSWSDCMDQGTHSPAMCDMWWCGCMYGKYGYVCPETA